MDKKVFLKECRAKMDNTLAVLEHDLGGLRTGRASAALLDPVSVEAYGSRMPINQVATVAVADARTISVQVWDKSMVKAVEKGISDSGLGIVPMVDGQILRLNMPPLTQERRKEIVKLAYKYGESSKVSMRNVRRDFLDVVKKLEKDGDISKDDLHLYNDDVQKIMDEYAQTVDNKVKQKEQEIMTV